MVNVSIMVSPGMRCTSPVWPRELMCLIVLDDVGQDSDVEVARGRVEGERADGGGVRGKTGPHGRHAEVVGVAAAA